MRTSSRCNDAVNPPCNNKALRLTPSQQAAWEGLQRFLADPKARVFILCGCAGTGKTMLLARLAHELQAQDRHLVLLAPTGRAARVLTNRTGMAAQTIHSHIYDFDHLSITCKNTATKYCYTFVLSSNADNRSSVYFVDESSMISDHATEGETLQFGSGRLLSDFIQFVFDFSPEESERKIIFAGDPIQLPPVHSTLSPALDVRYLAEHFALAGHVYASELTDVVRVKADSPLLDLASSLRDGVRQQDFSRFVIEPRPETIEVRTTLDLDDWVRRLREQPAETRVLITHSNLQAFYYNSAMRARLFPNAAGPQPGDKLVVMNNARMSGITLFNGDILEVVHAAPTCETDYVELPPTKRRPNKLRVELRFREITVRSLDSGATTNVKLFENLLDRPQREITSAERQALFLHFLRRHKGLNPRSEDFLVHLANDKYFHALQAKYAYALTCHKAQGGEWWHVAVDFNTSHADTMSEEYYRWAYTAITRSQQHLIAINPPLRTPDADLLKRLLHAAPPPEPAVISSTAACEIARYDSKPWPPERRALLLALQLIGRECRALLLSAVNKDRRISVLFTRGVEVAEFDCLISSQNVITHVLSRNRTMTAFAAELEQRLHTIENRPVILKATKPRQITLSDAALPNHAPFPESTAPAVMHQFDEALRARLASTKIVIEAIEYLTEHQVRYVYSEDHTGQRAAILYFFNAHRCTSFAVDGRRTTSPELAGRVLALHRPEQT